METFQIRRSQNGALKAVKTIDPRPKPCPEKLLIVIQRERKTFHDKNRFKAYIQKASSTENNRSNNAFV